MTVIIPIRTEAPADDASDDKLCWRALGCTGTCNQGRSPCTCGVELRREAYYAAMADEGVALDPEEVREVIVILGVCIVALCLVVAVAMGWLPLDWMSMEWPQ